MLVGYIFFLCLDHISSPLCQRNTICRTCKLYTCEWVCNHVLRKKARKWREREKTLLSISYEKTLRGKLLTKSTNHYISTVYYSTTFQKLVYQTESNVRWKIPLTFKVQTSISAVALKVQLEIQVSMRIHSVCTSRNCYY